MIGIVIVVAAGGAAVDIIDIIKITSFCFMHRLADCVVCSFRGVCFCSFFFYACFFITGLWGSSSADKSIRTFLDVCISKNKAMVSF